MKRIRAVVGVGFGVLLCAVCFGQQGPTFFRIVSPTNSEITAFGANGIMGWTNAATVGVTCVVQRATTLAEPSNWVDYVQHEVTNAVMNLRLFDSTASSGMALIPAGSFHMGENFSDGYPDEFPVHTVYLSAFYMEKTEVTWAKWKEVRDWSTNGNGYVYDNAGAGKAESHPVQTVSWHDVVKWCNARSQKEGRPLVYFTDAALTQEYKSGQTAPYVRWSVAGYRLPTEAEWEKAARGGPSSKRFPWGDTIQHSRANYVSVPVFTYDTSPTQGYHPSFAVGDYPYTSPAGSFSPNGYGLYDVVGNVWEWCWDWYGSEYYETSPSSNPSGPSSGSLRVVRCGGWGNYAAVCRSAVRNNASPHLVRNDFGFRVVLSLGQ